MNRVTFVAALLVFACWSSSGVRARADRQNGPATGPAVNAAPVPRLPNGRPDLSGVWEKPHVQTCAERPRQRGYPDLPFTPAGLDDWKSYDARNGDYTGSCMPIRAEPVVNSPCRCRDHARTRVYCAALRAEHPGSTSSRCARAESRTDTDPTWFGSSIGRWDGDTLVVDTIGFNESPARHRRFPPFGRTALWIQTFRATDADHSPTMTIDDPQMY